MSVYVDTSAFLAVLNADDENHERARSTWADLLTRRTPLVCSSYVLLETYAAVQSAPGMDAVGAFHEDILPLRGPDRPGGVSLRGRQRPREAPRVRARRPSSARCACTTPPGWSLRQVTPSLAAYPARRRETKYHLSVQSIAPVMQVYRLCENILFLALCRSTIG